MEAMSRVNWLTSMKRNSCSGEKHRLAARYLQPGQDLLKGRGGVDWLIACLAY